MKDEITEASGPRLMPWDFQPRALLREAAGLIHCDAAAMGVLASPTPGLDEVLASIDCDARSIAQWCGEGAADDTLFKAARSRGAATGSALEQGRHSPTGGGQALVAAASHSLQGRTWWWLSMARRRGGFTEAEQRLGEALVRKWRTRLCQPSEPGIGRLILGHDDRLIAADPWTDARLVTEPALLEGLLRPFHAMVRQRWPNLTDDERHDVFIELGGQVCWIVFHRARGVDAPQGAYWYLELRPSSAEEMLAQGVVEDARIGLSLAFLHDHYHDTPSLAQTAEVVHISPFHFHRLFTREVGLSPKHYLQRKQLQMARWLLRTSRMPVGEIASRIGFASHGHFTSTFHRIVGVSPTEYREKH